MIAAVIVLLAVFILLVVRAITGRMSDRSFMFKFLLALDMFVCAIVLGNTDMTISSRCGLALEAEVAGRKHSEFLCWLGTLLNLISAHHCVLAISHDISRARGALDILLEAGEV